MASRLEYVYVCESYVVLDQCDEPPSLFVLSVVAVVRLPRPMEGNGVTPISDPYRTASSTTGGWSRWNILMCFIYIYHSEHYDLSFLDLTDVPFLQIHSL